MAKKKKNAADSNDMSAAEAGQKFGISLKDLKTLMQTRGQDGVKELNEIHGGSSAVGEKLKTNLITGNARREKQPYRADTYSSVPLFFCLVQVCPVRKLISLSVWLHLVVMRFLLSLRKHSFA